MSKAKSAGALVAFMWFAYFLNYCDRQAVFSMFPSLKADLGMTDKQLGLTGAIFLWVYAFGCPIAGQLADRFSKRLLVVLSLIVWSLVTVATGFAGSAFMLLGLRAAMGISESLFMPTAIALTANAHPPELRSRAIAVLTTAQIAGTVAGSWFGGWMADRGQWRGAFFVLGAVGLLYALPYFAFLRGVNENPTAETVTPSKSLAFPILLRVRSFLLLCVVFPIFVFGLWLLYGWLPTFLKEKFALNQADAAFNATIFLQLTTAIGLLGGGVLADKLYRRTKASRLWLMTASLILCAPCLHFLGSSDTLAVTRIAAASFGLFSGLLMGNIFPAAFEVVPADTRASAVGILNFCGAIMSGFATLFGGMWKQSLGIDRLLSITALAYLAAGIALVVGIKTLFPRDLVQTQISS
ncbi:MFS transporter [Prosthecobacter sp.]|uniref:MFS transporter n=1 Tax=Prosthecobacter sp. TaxID=1965333 RepID=UPI002AB83FF4|nr:MFS transporter [Prosthecobacter sp.]MDZ4401436.1 MFS transporter [Prosthecobacter sp.]